MRLKYQLMIRDSIFIIECIFIVAKLTYFCVISHKKCREKAGKCRFAMWTLQKAAFLFNGGVKYKIMKTFEEIFSHLVGERNTFVNESGEKMSS